MAILDLNERVKGGSGRSASSAKQSSKAPKRGSMGSARDAWRRWEWIWSWRERRRGMAIIAKENFEKMIRECLSRFCDKEISDTTENVDPEGYNKVRTVTWHYRPYTFKAAYIFGGSEEYPNFCPLGIMARLDGSSEEEKLRTGNDLVDKIRKANLMREAGMV